MTESSQGSKTSNSQVHSQSQDQFQPLLHVLDPAQLQVILLFTHNASPTSNYMQQPASNNSHSMQTRLKTEAIERKNYAAYLASFPELQSLNIDDTCDGAFTGYSFIADIHDGDEAKTFKTVASNPKWQQAMQ